MSRRSIATVKRPDLHPYQPDPADPTSCRWIGGGRRCLLPGQNSVHDPAALAERDARIHAAQEAHRARTGEHEW